MVVAPSAVLPIELYTLERIAEFLGASEVDLDIRLQRVKPAATGRLRARRGWWTCAGAFSDPRCPASRFSCCATHRDECWGRRSIRADGKRDHERKSSTCTSMYRAMAVSIKVATIVMGGLLWCADMARRE